MRVKTKRNFILQQGFEEPSPAVCPRQYSALSFSRSSCLCLHRCRNRVSKRTIVLRPLRRFVVERPASPAQPFRRYLQCDIRPPSRCLSPYSRAGTTPDSAIDGRRVRLGLRAAHSFWFSYGCLCCGRNIPGRRAGTHSRGVLRGLVRLLPGAWKGSVRPTNATLGELNYGGEGGIRTPDTLLRCNCLAGSPVRPLQHLSVSCQGFCRFAEQFTIT